MGEYEDFLRRKTLEAPPTGVEPTPEVVAAVERFLFPFQLAIVLWALRRGRAAVFADTGLGKTRMQVAWAWAIHRLTGERVLVFAPLAVAEQTVDEARSVGVEVAFAQRPADAPEAPIVITNYDRREAFAPDTLPAGIRPFGAVALDESSILKNETGATRQAIVDAYAGLRFKTAWTATPSPNDHAELGNHAEFLGVMRQREMLAMFFTHDGGETQKWSLKGHARERFWAWVCGWAAIVKRPSDLGYSDEGYDLPDLVTREHVVAATREQARDQGLLFAEKAATLLEQRRARRASLPDRVRVAAEVVLAEPAEAWVIWCELNDESAALTKAIRAGGVSVVEVRGDMAPEDKRRAFVAFARGDVRAVVTKPKIAGFGLNWQHAARMVFVGVTHSFEQWYQAVRREWRFGQRRPVHCHVVVAEVEGKVLENLRRKEEAARVLAEETRAYTREIVRANVTGSRRDETRYEPKTPMRFPWWLRTAPEAPR